jgi:hypothetical protein
MYELVLPVSGCDIVDGQEVVAINLGALGTRSQRGSLVSSIEVLVLLHIVSCMQPQLDR